MKAITVKQPWASAIIWGGKDVENRTWSTKYRGPLAIHAGSGSFTDFDPYKWIRLTVGPSVLGEIRQYHRVRGSVLGVVDLIGCVREYDSPWAMPGCWHWVLAYPRAFVSPLPMRGKLGLWTIPMVAHQIEALKTASDFK